MRISHKRWGIFAVHVGVILLVTLSALALLSGGDESIGGGALLLLLIAAGLPWTLVPLLALTINGNVAATITYSALALANALILEVWRVHRARHSVDEN